MENDSYECAERFIELRDNAQYEMARSFLAHGRKRTKWRAVWRPVDGETVARIWLTYGKRGTVFESEALAKIAEQVLSLIARLSAANAIAGHDSHDPRPEIEEDTQDFTAKQWERFVDGMETENGTWLVSDYGLRPLEALFGKLFSAKTDEERLMTIDRVFNIVHQRGDLSALFITGGKDTLNKIANQGGYVTPFADYSDQIAQQRQLCAR